MNAQIFHLPWPGVCRLFALLILFLSLGSPSPAEAQKFMEGLWEGTITRGGLETTQGYRFQLFLQIKGNRIEGRSYVHLGKDQVVEMTVRGYIYQDRSVYFEDVEFIPLEGSKVAPEFFRKYQMVFTRSIWENKLEGYWQQIQDSPLEERREIGRILLKKIEGSKA